LGRGRGRLDQVELMTASGLETLQLSLRSGIGTLQAALGLPQAIEEADLVGVVLENVDFAYFQARQFPLRDGHLLQIELFGTGAGLPFGFQIVAQLMEFLAILGRQDDGAGAQAVTEGFQVCGHMFF
jgi:hypothetical protein